MNTFIYKEFWIPNKLISHAKAFFYAQRYSIIFIILFQCIFFTCYFFYNHVTAQFQLTGDQVDYNLYANNLMPYKFLSLVNNSVDRLPGFVLFITVIYKLFGINNFLGVFIGNSICTAFVNVALYWASLKITGKRLVGLLACFFFIVNPVTPFFNFSLLSEPFAAFVMLYTFVFLYLSVQYNSFLCWIFMSFLYLIAFFTKIFIFYLYPIFILCFSPFLFKKKRILLFFCLVATFIAACLAYHYRTLYVKSEIGYSTFSYATEIVMNQQAVSNIMYYEANQYKTDQPGTRKLSQPFLLQYNAIKVQKGEREANKMRAEFYWEHKQGFLMNATDGILMGLFAPTRGFYIYRPILPQVAGLTSEQAQDVFYLIYHLDKKGIKLYLCQWIAHILILIFALTCVMIRLRVNIFVIAAIALIIFLLGPVEGFFTGSSDIVGRFRYVALPFIAFCYAVAVEYIVYFLNRNFKKK